MKHVHLSSFATSPARLTTCGLLLRGKLTTQDWTRNRGASPQMLAFNAATGNALTIFLAGFAFTTTTFPNTSLFPALVAGFMRVLILTSPGSVKTPVLFASLVPISASVAKTLPATDF